MASLISQGSFQAFSFQLLIATGGGMRTAGLRFKTKSSNTSTTGSNTEQEAERPRTTDH
jgi:hypothetical protein